MNKIDNIRKNTTNYPMGSHEKFCMRCLTYNKVSVLKLAVNPHISAKSK